MNLLVVIGNLIDFFFTMTSGVDAHIALEFHEARGNLKLLLGRKFNY